MQSFIAKKKIILSSNSSSDVKYRMDGWTCNNLKKKNQTNLQNADMKS